MASGFQKFIDNALGDLPPLALRTLGAERRQI
jgi:hypothetical protein